MAGEHIVTPPGQRNRGAWHRARQFGALLKKNLLLQTRSRKTFLGLGGWGALIVQVLLPACFFLLMCIPKYYIKPIKHGEQLTAQAPDLESRWWSGPNPYSGPAMQRNVSYNAAHVVLAPDTPAVRALAGVLARTLACPRDPTMRTSCLPHLPPSSFYCLFIPLAAAPDAPPLPDHCVADADTCTADPACWDYLLSAGLISFADSEAAAVDEAVDTRPPWADAIIVFQDARGDEPASRGSGAAPASHGLLRFTIRMNHSDVPPTRLLLDAFDVFPSRDNGLSFYRHYWFFANLQHAVQRSVLGMRLAELSPGSPAPAPGNTSAYDAVGPMAVNLAVKPFPWPAVVQDLGAASAAVFFNLLMVYAFLSPARGVVGGIVREKELRLREGMRLMGLMDGAYWGSWFVTHWATLLASGVLCAVVGLYPFRHTDFTLMVAFFALFTAALITFSYFLSTLFSASRVAGAGAQLLYALAMLPGFLAPSVAPYAGSTWYLCCLLPPGAASLWAACLINWELVSQGLTWRTAGLPIVQGSSFCATSVLWLLAADVVLYSVLAWYLDKVLPTSPSTPLHPLFFLHRAPAVNDGATKRAFALPSSPGPSGLAHTATPSVPDSPAAGLVLGASNGSGPQAFAPLDILVTTGGPPGPGGAPRAPAGGGVVVHGLRKAFPTSGGGHVQALDGASLAVRPGAITALLGHNGAGKTTLISILTGLEAADAGRAWVNGLDVGSDMEAIRTDLGVCPQFDVVWPELSVVEHLRLHAALRGGAAARNASAVVPAAVREVGLSGCEDRLAGDLSGGQRRKLSLAIALVGTPSIVLVDEPTSGMDPATRRFTWELLQRTAAGGGPGGAPGSAVLLTTHSMDEAEALADQVVIMAHGRVVARGSPHELKTQFGEGYTLTVVLASSDAADRVRALVAATVPNADLPPPHAVQPQQSGQAEVTFRLPRDATPAFPALLRGLDAMLPVEGDEEGGPGRGDVSSYGISATTLEEVFIRVTEGAAVAAAAEQSRRNRSTAAVTAWFHGPPGVSGGEALPVREAGPRPALLTGWQLTVRQLGALLVKRALGASRERLTLLTQLLAPLLLVALALWVSALSLRSPDEAPLAADRAVALLGAPTVLAAAPGVRNNTAAWTAWRNAYTRVGRAIDSDSTSLWSSGLSPNASVLEGYLLRSWYAGSPAAPASDALFLQQVSIPSGPAPGVSLKAVVLVNQSAVHAVPASVSQVSDAVLAVMEAAAAAGTARGKHSGPPEQPPRFHVTNHPLPTLAVEPNVRIQRGATGLLLVVCLTLAASLMSASVAVAHVRERACGAKHVQLVSGAGPAVFWAANALWDYASLSVTGAAMVALIAAYHLPQYQGARLAAVASLLAVFQAAGMALTYLLQRIFTDEMLALQRLNTGYFMVGYLGFVATWIIDLILLFTRPPRLVAANAWVKAVARTLSPHFCFAKGVYDIGQTAGSDLPIPLPGRETNPWAWAVWGSPMAYMAAQAAAYLLLTVLLDGGLGVPGALAALADLAFGRSGGTRRATPLHVPLLDRGAAPDGASWRRGEATEEEEVVEEDVDVAAEREAVQGGVKRAANSQMLIDGVRKTYRSGLGWRWWASPLDVRAVRGLWLGVPAGECFGLLGVNGAGKTTTFAMLTGAVAPDAGEAAVCGHSVRSAPGAARRHTGFCPQAADALPGALTPEEVLTLYARLRGLPEHAIRRHVRSLLRRLGVDHATSLPCASLSGGNKRKLALGVALVGGPVDDDNDSTPVVGAPTRRLVLLDEPSTGVDPGARRTLWSLVRAAVSAGRGAVPPAGTGPGAGGPTSSVVLTSHSMEECEALCDRLCIMVAGRAACLGTCQHLKTRFGGGYVLDATVHAAGQEAAAAALLDNVRRICPGAALQAGHGGVTVTGQQAGPGEGATPVAVADVAAQFPATVHIPREDVAGPGRAGTLVALFELLEADVRAEGDRVGAITSYTIRQATLESVFLRMGHAQPGAGPVEAPRLVVGG